MDYLRKPARGHNFDMLSMLLPTDIISNSLTSSFSATASALPFAVKDLDQVPASKEIKKKRAARKSCKVEGCKSQVQRFGVCYRHGGKKSCRFPGCEKKNQGRGYCSNHASNEDENERFSDKTSKVGREGEGTGERDVLYEVGAQDVQFGAAHHYQ